MRALRLPNIYLSIYLLFWIDFRFRPRSRRIDLQYKKSLARPPRDVRGNTRGAAGRAAPSMRWCVHPWQWSLLAFSLGAMDGASGALVATAERLRSSTVYEPHRNFQRWQAERAIEKERQNALVQSVVVDGAAAARERVPLPAAALHALHGVAPLGAERLDQRGRRLLAREQRRLRRVARRRRRPRPRRARVGVGRRESEGRASDAKGRRGHVIGSGCARAVGVPLVRLDAPRAVGTRLPSTLHLGPVS